MSDNQTDGHINIIINQRDPLKLDPKKHLAAALKAFKVPSEPASPLSKNKSLSEVPGKNFIVPDSAPIVTE